MIPISNLILPQPAMRINSKTVRQRSYKHSKTQKKLLKTNTVKDKKTTSHATNF